MALKGVVKIKKEIAFRFTKYRKESGMHLTTKANELLDNFLKEKGF